MKIPLQNSNLQFAIGDRISQIFIHCLQFIRIINFDETGNLMKIFMYHRSNLYHQIWIYHLQALIYECYYLTRDSFTLIRGQIQIGN